MFLYYYWRNYKTFREENCLIFKSLFIYNIMVLTPEMLFGLFALYLLYMINNITLFVAYIVCYSILIYATATYRKCIIFNNKARNIVEKSGFYPLVRRKTIIAYESIENIYIDKVKVWPTRGVKKIDEYSLIISGLTRRYTLLKSTDYNYLSAQKDNIKNFIRLKEKGILSEHPLDLP